MGLYKGHQAEPLWGSKREGYGIIWLPFSPTPTAAALVQHRHTERGKAGAQLALKSLQHPLPPFLPPPFDLSGHVSFVQTTTGQAKGGGRVTEDERDSEKDPFP